MKIENETIIMMLKDYGPGPVTLLSMAIAGLSSVVLFPLYMICPLLLVPVIIVLGVIYLVESIYWRPLSFLIRKFCGNV